MEYTIEKKTGAVVPACGRAKLSKLDAAKEAFKIEGALCEMRSRCQDADFEATMAVDEFCKCAGFPVGTSADYLVHCALNAGHLICHRNGQMVWPRGAVTKEIFERAVKQSQCWETGKEFKETKKGTSKRSAIEYA